MFVSYALTLACTFFPCTTHVVQDPSTTIVIDTPTHSYPLPHPYQQPRLYSPVYQIHHPFVSLPTAAYTKAYNLSSSDFIAVHSSQQSTGNNNVDYYEDDPKATLPPFDDYPIVQIKDGGLKGFTMKTINNHSIHAFKGIPFAQPPVKELRFKAPLKNEPWSGVRDAFADSPTCIQADFMQQYRIHGQEDCLYLNVYKPIKRKDQELLPVMVFIHPGGWFFSSSSLYGPSYLLDEQEVVLVTMNYRLGVFGFLSTGDEASPGNWGLKDQTLALKWVQENIAAFGGDPDRVTIFGESAGASSVHFHMLSPLSKGLFHGGISQSGSATCFWSIDENAPQLAKQYSNALNCSGPTTSEMVDCLRGKDAGLLVGMQLALLQWTMYPVVIFGPVVEPEHPGAFLTQTPEEIYTSPKTRPNYVPWISGFNTDEGAINIAILFIGNGSVSQLNKDWDKWAPVFLGMSREKEAGNLVERVRSQYLGQDEITLQNKAKVVDMFSDRYVLACGIKGVQLHAKHSPRPTYSYRLSYKGKYSVVQALGQRPEDWGVSHLDDLIYLFNNTAYYPELKVEDEEYQVSRMIIGMWTHFAKTGKAQLPSFPSSSQRLNELRSLQDSTKPEWTPVIVNPGEVEPPPLAYMDINLTPTMVTEDPFFHDRIKFWRSLDLEDV